MTVTLFVMLCHCPANRTGPKKEGNCRGAGYDSHDPFGDAQFPQQKENVLTVQKSVCNLLRCSEVVLHSGKISIRIGFQIFVDTVPELRDDRLLVLSGTGQCFGNIAKIMI